MARQMHQPLRTLVLYCSGGSGLLQAAIAKEQEITQEYQDVEFIRRDLLKDWFWKFVGRYGIRKWDSAQRVGDVKTLDWLIRRQRMGDLFFWPWIFCRALSILFREKIDRVIDTQPLGTSAVLLALRIYNKVTSKEIYLEKISVDLPTERNTHFFHPIKKVSQKSKKWLRFITLPPLLDDPNQTDQLFWDKHCKLSMDQIIYEYYPVRQSFRSFQGKARELVPFSFEASFSSAEEGELLNGAIQNSSLNALVKQGTVLFSIAPEDKVITLLLGSQPAFTATIGYVTQMQKLVEEAGDQNIHLFVLCAKHIPKEETLFKKVASLAKNSSLNVIPLSFQNDRVLAPLFFRSDLTCTRSGGQTLMELMCVMQGEIWIHSEAKGLSLAKEALLSGIPGWEAGNALYMEQFYQAKIVTPELCSNLFRKLLQRWRFNDTSNTEPDFPNLLTENRG